MARDTVHDPGRLRLLKERPRDDAAIEEMTAAAFGPDRLHKTVYRLREDVPALKDLCFVCIDQKNRLVRFTAQRKVLHLSATPSPATLNNAPNREPVARNTGRHPARTERVAPREACGSVFREARSEGFVRRARSPERHPTRSERVARDAERAVRRARRHARHAERGPTRNREGSPHSERRSPQARTPLSVFPIHSRCSHCAARSSESAARSYDRRSRKTPWTAASAGRSRVSSRRAAAVTGTASRSPPSYTTMIDVTWLQFCSPVRTSAWTRK